MGIDFGTKRTGLAVTDPLQIIASGLDTVATAAVLDYIEKYLGQEEVIAFVVGEPMHMDGNPAQIAPQVNEFIKQLQKRFPTITVHRQDERFTSVDAKRIILLSGAKKKKRRDKALVDKVSAVLILQDFMETQRLNR